MAVRDTPANDVTACAAAFAREAIFVQQSLRRHGIAPADADDLTHEVLIVMWRRWSDFNRSRPLRPWLAGIVYKVAHRHRHRLLRQRAVAQAAVEEVDPAPSLEEQVETRRQRALAQRALGTLGDRHRVVLVLHDMDGLSLDEVAGIFTVPRSTAFSRLRAARTCFAKAVRRLQVIEQAAGRALPDAPALLATARAEQAPAAEAPDPEKVERARKILLALPIGARPSQAPWLSGAAAAVMVLAALAGTWFARRSAPVPTVARATASTASLARGLVGHYRFDETEGSLASDGSGHGNHCRLRRRPPGVAWAPGLSGGAIQLERDGWLECPPSASWARPSVELSVAAWVRLPGGRSGVQTVLARQQAADVRDDFFFGFFAHTPLVDELVVNSRTWATRVAVPLFRARGRWIHVAATQARDGATTLFVDGKAAATRWSKRPEEHLQAAKTVLIGGGANGPEPRAVNQLFEGELDELRVYERALAAEEVQALAAGRAL